MAKSNVMDVTNEIYKRLEPLGNAERTRVIEAVIALFGQEKITYAGGGVTPSDAHKYFGQKDPHTKEEILAVAARFREQHKNQHKHKKEDFRSVIHQEARRNFDNLNFSWDIRNAKEKGFFNRSREIQLSYYGQQYVDALPDREKLKNLRAPARRRKKASRTKKVAKKKSKKV